MVSPDLDPSGEATPIIPALTPTSTSDYPQAFFPTSSGDYVMWSIHLADNAGNLVSVQLPLVFVFATGSDAPFNEFDATQMGEIATAYNALGQQASPSDLVTTPVAGTPILYAPEVTTNGVAAPGATTHPTLAITLGAATPVDVPTPTPNPPVSSDQYVPPNPSPVSEATLTAANQPAFYPSLLAGADPPAGGRDAVAELLRRRRSIPGAWASSSTGPT